MLECYPDTTDKNYTIKGYQPFVETKIFERFEESDTNPKFVELNSAKKLRLKKQKVIDHLLEQKQEIKKYEPESDPKIKGDPYKTIIVSKLNYKTDEDKLYD